MLKASLNTRNPDGEDTYKKEDLQLSTEAKE